MRLNNILQNFSDKSKVRTTIRNVPVFGVTVIKLLKIGCIEIISEKL